MDNPPDKIIVSRLVAAYGVNLREAYPLAKVEAATPQGFIPDGNRGEDYDLGRVHYFLQQIRQGKTLDPISVDCRWSGWSPVHIIVTDGHHRLAAMILARKRFILAWCSGPVDGIEWMTGQRKTRPEWA